MKRFSTTAFIALFVLGASLGSRVHGQKNRSDVPNPVATFKSITAQEINLLLLDVAETNPMVLKRLREDPEMKRAQIDNLRQLLAFASEAQRVGLADKPQHKNELENIRSEVIAVTYDRWLNKGKPAQAPFGSITDAAIAAFWGDAPNGSGSPALKAERKAEFDQFLETKLALIREANPQGSDHELGADEIAQSRDVFAKIQIYSGEYSKRASALPLTFRQKVDLQVKLQQAQYLARLYSERFASEVSASDDEISAYLREHPELDASAKRVAAEKILVRAKNGEDFAELANEFSEDPGNKNDQGQLQGGIYRNVSRGAMLPAFEHAALALEAGQIAPEIVESDYGFHIIKLERKDATERGTYDVRHVLIGTSVIDPSDPTASPMPLKAYARKEIESEKEKLAIERIVAANKISVPNDFVVPAVRLPAPAKATQKAKPRPARKRT
jgi:parvulin-like peptidyl-prolyl isomerase